MAVFVMGALLPLLAPRPALAHTRVYVEIAPPAPIVEVRAVAPSPYHVWIAGYHRWEGGRYVWVPGHYEVPPRHRSYWVAGHWVEHRHHGWYWVEGHWH
jgi:hypothetical protein